MRKTKFHFSEEAIYLTEKEWRELLRRFDSSKAVESKKSGFYEIPGKGCYLCTLHRKRTGACGGCPLDTEANSCGDFMQEIVGSPFAFHADVNTGVSWMKGGVGKEDVEKIYNALMSMERVRERG